MISPEKVKTVAYEQGSINRGKRALQCSSFEWHLLETMANHRVTLGEIAGSRGKIQGYTRRVITETKAERELIWLIEVGLLRREVDGQGITDSFRLTPLTRIILAEWASEQVIPAPNLGDRLGNFFTRWLRWGV